MKLLIAKLQTKFAVNRKSFNKVKWRVSSGSVQQIKNEMQYSVLKQYKITEIFVQKLEAIV